MEAEDENFRLFSYVNQLNAEIEKLEDSIAELTREIAKHRGESTTHDAEKARAVKALDERLRRAETRARMYDRKYATATATASASRATPTASAPRSTTRACPSGAPTRSVMS